MLYDGKGNPVSSSSFKRAAQPRTGSVAAAWGSDGQPFRQLPQGGIVQFNLDNLTVADFRAMRDHYQVNASLAVLSFMQHQSDWHIECEDKKIADECETQLREMWTPLNRGLSAANWAGYSPNIIDWQNDPIRGKVVIDKIRDLIPESAEVNWRKEDAWVPPIPNGPLGAVNQATKKINIYDGIKQVGGFHPIPAENTIWYPLLMENGDYKGRKLLKAAFTSWYFSILIHLFANRYYERFGEPIVVSRAPFETSIKLPGTDAAISGVDFMTQQVQGLRNRSIVLLPDDQSPVGDGGQTAYDYQMEYLESQMRGADWERYLTRLDEEISIGLFTPILLLRTADVGSYNLGVGHMQMYLWMLNAMNDDRAQYINKYILNRIVDFNFSPKAARAKIKFRKLGNQNAELVQAIVTALTTQGRIKFDVTELGEIAGMSMEEIQATVAKTEEEPPDAADPEDEDARTQGDPNNGLASSEPRATAKQITARIADQVNNHFRNGTWAPGASLNMGFKRKMENSLYRSQCPEPQEATSRLYARLDDWIENLQSVAGSAQEFVDMFSRAIEYEVTEVERGN